MRSRNYRRALHFPGRRCMLLLTAMLILSLVIAGTASTKSSVRETVSKAPAGAGVAQEAISQAAGTCTTPKFTKAPGSPAGAGDSPVSVAVGDFNRDGKQDLAVANFISDNLTIRLGDGTGRFPDAMASTIAVGNAPESVAIGDFNNDGKQDLVVGKLFSNDVTVLLGDGAGGFPDTMDSTVGAGVNPIFVGIGDFNRDGNQDLAVVSFGDSLVNFCDQCVTIRLGDGTGGFPDAMSSTVGAGTRPDSVAIGDFNRDGKQDLAVANGGNPDFDPTLRIRLGDGEGGFPDAMASTIHLDTRPSLIVTADFNRDGIPDLALTGGHTVSIRLGDGAGGFPDSKASPVSVGDGPQSVAVGDFNHDGKPDLAVANSASDNVTVRLGDGAGGFPDAMALTVSTGDGPQSVAIGDFNRDGKEDLAVTNAGSDNVSILLNSCSTTPCAGKLNSLTFNQNSVLGGQHVTGTVTLMCASNKDVVVRLTSNKPAARPDVSTLTIPAGQTSATFGITTLDISDQPRDVIFTASTSSGYVRATLNVRP